MRTDILNQLKANSDWLDKTFPSDDSGFAQWAKAQCRAAIELYKAGDYEAVTNALAVCIAQFCMLYENKTDMRDEETEHSDNCAIFRPHSHSADCDCGAEDLDGKR